MTLDEKHIIIEGDRVTGLLVRPRGSAGFAATFNDADRSFASAEASALLLAAMQLPSVRVVNRYGPRSWYEASPWASWRDVLAVAGASTSPLASSNHGFWLPHTVAQAGTPPSPRVRNYLGSLFTTFESVTTILIAAGRPVETSVGADIARILQEAGINLASVLVDGYGNAVAVDPDPQIPEQQVATVAESLADWLLDEL